MVLNLNNFDMEYIFGPICTSQTLMTSHNFFTKKFGEIGALLIGEFGRIGASVGEIGA